MRRALVLSIPLYLAVPVIYALGIGWLGYDVAIGPLLAGAAGWLVALVLRALALRTEATRRWCDHARSKGA